MNCRHVGLLNASNMYFCNQQAFLACEGKQLERFKQASSIEESKSQPHTSKLPPVESCESSALHFVRSNQRPGAAEHA